MSALDDLKWLVMVLGGLFIAWVIFGSRGGIGGPFIRPPAPLGPGGTYGGTIEQGDTENNNDDSGTDLRDLPGELDRIRGLANSKYKDQVEISRHSAKRTSPDEERIEIEVNRNVSERIPITGWRVESAVSGVGVNIGEGTYLPYSGRVNTESFIFVEAGDKVIITTGRSPIGNSFRLNQCTGYFEQFQDFEPSLPRNCPKAIDDLPNVGVGNEADKCINFVEDITRCKIYLDEIPFGLGGTCTEYVSLKINYNSCVDLHKNDLGFYENEWRVYLERNEELWRSNREIIQIIDQEGKVVDAITY